MAIGLAIAGTVTAPAGLSARGPDPSPIGPQAASDANVREVLLGPLRRLAEADLSGYRGSALLDGLVTRPSRTEAEIAVTIRLDGAADAGTIAELSAVGARIVNAGARTVEAYVAPARLAGLARLADVRAITPIRRPRPASVSLGVSLQGALDWQAAGFTGAGVKVGIIDGGFQGLAARVGTELPAAVTARCYTEVGTYSSDPAACENGEIHGTAVAETIVDMAPEAELFLANPISQLDTAQTITWLTANGVRIVNASWSSGHVFEGPGDGTSPYSDSTYALLDRAVAGGALWVNSAGNEGEQGWTGSWADADADGLLEWSGADELNRITLAAGDEVVIAIRWADPWGGSSNDYDLALLSGSTVVASGEDVQAGSGDPFEIIEYTTPASGVYGIRVNRGSGDPTTRLQLLVFGPGDMDLDHQVSAGTLPAPADSGNSGMVTVGAVGLVTPDTAEPYSSRGPTLDGRIKPDLVAIDCAPTTVTALFCGTSESAPFVSGAAALLLQASPELTPAQLADELRSNTVPLGSPIPNATYGWGRLSLGPPPVGPPAGLQFAWPPTGAVAGAPLTGQPAIRIADAGGTTVSVGSSSTAIVTLALGANPTGATLTCEGGLAKPAVAGVATFTGCSIDRPGAGYTVQASVAGLPAVDSALFEILLPGSPLPLTISASAGLITWPAAVSLAGQLSPVPASAGRAVEFQRSVDGLAWTAVGSATSDATGLAGLANRPTTNVWYRAFFPGGPDLAAATSYPVRVTVRQAITLTASLRPPRMIARGTLVAFTSTVRPLASDLPRPKVTFVVYRRVGGSWVLFRRADVTADSTGRARFSWRFSTAGSWYVRSRAAATSSVATSAWSAVARYDVR